MTGLFAELGARTVSADDLAREVVAPGTDGLAAIEQRFGSQMRREDGTLNRAALAQVVFTDPQARRDLEAITHPLIQQRFLAIRQQTPPDQLLCYEIPLLAEIGRASYFDHVVVVQADEASCLARLQQRGLTLQQARERIASQVDSRTREQLADTIIDNSGSLEATRAHVLALWKRLPR